jgi:hypothetical protein
MTRHESEKAIRNSSGNITRDPFVTQTVNYCIDELFVTFPGRAIRTGSQEK